MRFISIALAALLAAAALFVTVPADSRAEVTGAAVRALVATAPGEVIPAATNVSAPRPGTHEEANEYARREARSPQVQKFSGGFIIALLVVAALVLLIIILAKEI